MSGPGVRAMWPIAGRAVTACLLVFVTFTTTSLLTDVASYSYDDLKLGYDGGNDLRPAPAVGPRRPDPAAKQHVDHGYDDAANLARASARLDAYRSAPEVLTPAQRGRYLFDNWHSATFPNRTQSINHHLARHGNGRTAFEYTRDAQSFFAQNRGLATQVTLRDGTAGLRIQTKVPVPGGGTRNVGGYWTTDGRLVTFWD